MSNRLSRPGLTRILRLIMGMWGRNAFEALWRTRRLQWGLIRSRHRRSTFRKEGLLVPMAVAISPTMKCNIACEGCYSRFHPRDDEMPVETLRSVIGEAVELGAFFFVVTGGEPYLVPEMLDIYERHRGVLFLTVTNGTLIDEQTASVLARSGNVLPVVSIEGTEAETDARRGEGVYRRAIACMDALRQAGVPFGFSAVVTRSTVKTLGGGSFVDEMIGRGCGLGFYNEFVPAGPEELRNVPDEDDREWFRQRIGRLRREKQIILLHLPDDEYDSSGRCMAVGCGGFHINSQGYVEPCPFAHYARENVREQSLREILQSPFLEAIRRHPTALQCGEIGCSLVNNRFILEEIASETGAKPTNP